MTQMRIIVADDVAPMLSMIADILGESFGILALVRDGRAALDAVLELEPDLIVLDIWMPGMTGLEVARRLHERRHKTKIVFLTLHEDAEIMAACLAAGALGYVAKILMHTDLIQAIHEALAGRVFVSSFSSQRASLSMPVLLAYESICRFLQGPGSTPAVRFFSVVCCSVLAAGIFMPEQMSLRTNRCVRLGGTTCILCKFLSLKSPPAYLGFTGRCSD
jgi:CheY-like chemotaxis protein